MYKIEHNVRMYVQYKTDELWRDLIFVANVTKEQQKTIIYHSRYRILELQNFFRSFL